MILLDFLQEHNIKLTKKGEAALIRAAKFKYPTMENFTDAAISYLILYLDFDDDEANSFIKIWSKYSKLDLFS